MTMEQNPINRPLSAFVQLIHYATPFVREDGGLTNMFLQIDGDRNAIHTLMTVAIENDPEFRRIVTDVINEYNKEHK